MDNQDIVREFGEMNKRISALEIRVGELAQSNAVLAAQTTPIVDWVKSQMTSGLTQRMDVLEKDMSGVKEKLDMLRSRAQWIAGFGAAIALAWAIWGENIKHMLGGAK